MQDPSICRTPTGLNFGFEWAALRFEPWIMGESLGLEPCSALMGQVMTDKTYTLHASKGKQKNWIHTSKFYTSLGDTSAFIQDLQRSLMIQDGQE